MDVVVHPLASEIVQVYVPGNNPVTDGVVGPPGIHK